MAYIQLTKVERVHGRIHFFICITKPKYPFKLIAYKNDLTSNFEIYIMHSFYDFRWWCTYVVRSSEYIAWPIAILTIVVRFNINAF